MSINWSWTRYCQNPKLIGVTLSGSKVKVVAQATRRIKVLLSKVNKIPTLDLMLHWQGLGIRLGLRQLMNYSLMHTLLGTVALAVVLIPVAALIIIVLLINLMQDKSPKYLPEKLRTWDILPLPLRSLQPLDNIINKLNCCCGDDNQRDFDAQDNFDICVVKDNLAFQHDKS